jgi:hypothetical protein
MKVTPEAKQRFKEATQVLKRYSERWHPSRESVAKSVVPKTALLTDIFAFAVATRPSSKK